MPPTFNWDYALSCKKKHPKDETITQKAVY